MQCVPSLHPDQCLTVKLYFMNQSKSFYYINRLDTYDKYIRGCSHFIHSFTRSFKRKKLYSVQIQQRSNNNKAKG